MKKPLFATAIGLAMAATAQAQTQTQTEMRTQEQTEGQTAVPAGQVRQQQQARQAAVPQTYTVEPGDRLASSLIGREVVNRQNERVGTIADMVVGQQGDVQAYVLSVGGFLGIGDHRVAVDTDMVKVTPQATGDPRLVMNASRESLKMAPAFTMEESMTRGATTGATEPEPRETTQPTTQPEPMSEPMTQEP